ncbi:Polycystin-1-like protein [Trichinella spiralis]|uniref:Polycystin-1-like protein n=1 Tax=Trichinella spiralis TaxID=6334 RepID=A0ABR3K868_TRISP
MFLRSMKQRSTLWSIVFTISGLLLLCVGSVALSLGHWEQNSDFWPVLFISIVLLTFGLLHLFSVKVLLHSNNAALKAPQSPLVAVVEYIHVKPQLLETSTQKRPSLTSTTTLPIGFLPSKNFPVFQTN